ncbi:hypothetical protein Barb7_01850 [Bacteroidales bacterium Barb7]|nr:hypothetical protein Barb7_01850 [Bacteroidales bacterium Barb7]
MRLSKSPCCPWRGLSGVLYFSMPLRIRLALRTFSYRFHQYCPALLLEGMPTEGPQLPTLNWWGMACSWLLAPLSSVMPAVEKWLK